MEADLLRFEGGDRERERDLDRDIESSRGESSLGRLLPASLCASLDRRRGDKGDRGRLGGEWESDLPRRGGGVRDGRRSSRERGERGGDGGERERERVRPRRGGETDGRRRTGGERERERESRCLTRGGERDSKRRRRRGGEGERDTGRRRCPSSRSRGGGPRRAGLLLRRSR